MVDATRSKIVSVRSEDSQKSIILAGVGVSAAIACQVCCPNFSSKIFKLYFKTYVLILMSINYISNIE